MKTTTLTTILLTAVTAVSQTTPGVIGITSATPFVAMQDPGTCAVSTCLPSGLAPRALPFEQLDFRNPRDERFEVGIVHVFFPIACQSRGSFYYPPGFAPRSAFWRTNPFAARHFLNLL